MACVTAGENVKNMEFVWSLEELCSQFTTNTHDLNLVFNYGQHSHQQLNDKWFPEFENLSKPKLSTTGILAFSVITASQGNSQLRDSLQVALTIMSAKDHERYFQRIPALSQHRNMFRAYVDLCLKFINVCESKTGALNSDTEIVVVWSSLLEPLGEMLNLILKDHLQRTSNQWLMNIPKPHNFDTIVERLKGLKDDGIYEQFYNYDFEGDERFQNGVQQILSRLEVGTHAAGQKNLDLLLQAKLFYFSRFYFEVELEGYEAWLNEKCNETYQPITEDDEANAEEVELLSVTETNEADEEDKGEETDDMASEEDALGGQDVMSQEMTATKDQDTDLLTDEEKVKKIGDTERQQPSSTLSSIGVAAGDIDTVGTSAAIDLQNDSIETSSSLNTNVTIHPKQDDSSNSADTPSMYPTSFMQMLQLVQDGKEIPGVEHLVIEPTNNQPTESRMERTAKPWQQ